MSCREHHTHDAAVGCDDCAQRVIVADLRARLAAAEHLAAEALDRIDVLNRRHEEDEAYRQTILADDKVLRADLAAAEQRAETYHEAEQAAWKQVERERAEVARLKVALDSAMQGWGSATAERDEARLQAGYVSGIPGVGGVAQLLAERDAAIRERDEARAKLVAMGDLDDPAKFLDDVEKARDLFEDQRDAARAEVERLRGALDRAIAWCREREGDFFASEVAAAAALNEPREHVTIATRQDGERAVERTFALPAWTCPACQAFNGEAKETLHACRACGGPRP